MPRPSPITPAQELELVRLYLEGSSRNQLAIQFKASRPFVIDCLRRHGVQPRTLKEACPGLPVNHAAFESAECDPDAAYWVGFLMADGCIGKQTCSGTPMVILNLAADDRSQVESFRTFLRSEHTIRDIPPGGGYGGGPGVRIDITSKQLATDLARYGVIPQKTYRTKVMGLENSPSFWRGVIDGDGSLHIGVRSNGKHKPRPVVQVTGSFDLMEQFADFAHRFASAVSRPHPDHSVWAVSLSCGPAVRLTRLLYSGRPVSLQRKLAVAEEILARFG